MFTRRELIALITGFAASFTTTILGGRNSKNYSIPTRKRNLPFFLGWYDYVTNIAVLDKVSAEEIDLLMPYVEKAEKEKIEEFLDASDRAGVKIMLEISRPLVVSENISGVKDFVQTFKNHPSVYGWYLYDEPEIRKPTPLSPESLERVYQAIKEEDQLRPIALVFADIKKIKPYMGAMDILMWDRYPCEVGVQEFQWISSYQKALNKVVDLATVNNKKFWNVLQAYSDKHSQKRLPTEAEFRYMFYLSVIAGADSLLFWMYDFSSNVWNQSVLYPTVKELKKYMPAIAKGEDLTNSVQINYSNIQFKLFTIPNTTKYLLIIVNQNHHQVNLTIKLTPALAGKSVAIKQETITHLSSQASFNALLNSYEVRLYQIG
ncbi:hypothetical protein I8748_16040 [Nostoc sp. CENA67]|uniref:Glycoside hydrolase family 42 N-terminal domain-containing protein n=1 Tax=Amazonocrinis nigriterrae CENA67 TaxID=2794033 RepID=A0A8J7HPS8_9NOST|nr:glycoside hydrolase family 2 TIM barrel-domain containing protein [Amazonocrinis nigriterrae]MBH8563683.1 hypothetical protein [Amazonocrinis nigriterrae CENA67]